MNNSDPHSLSGSRPEEVAQTTPAAEEAKSKQLTPEEQMARYEEDLKEHDWGHQPC